MAETINKTEASSPVDEDAKMNARAAAEQATKTMTPGQMTDKGLEYYNNKDYVNAFAFWMVACEMGNKNAQANIGNCYANGYGVPVNKVEAVYYWQKAADQESERGCFSMGNAYEKGLGGLPVDLKQARYWFEKSLELGYQDAQKRLDKLKPKGFSKYFDIFIPKLKSPGGIIGMVVFTILYIATPNINFFFSIILGILSGVFFGNLAWDKIKNRNNKQPIDEWEL